MCCLVILKSTMYQMLMSKLRLKVRKSVLIVQGVSERMDVFSSGVVVMGKKSCLR